MAELGDIVRWMTDKTGMIYEMSEICERLVK